MEENLVHCVSQCPELADVFRIWPMLGPTLNRQSNCFFTPELLLDVPKYCHSSLWLPVLCQ